MNDKTPTAGLLLRSIAVLLAVFAVAGLVVIWLVYRFEQPLAFILGLLVGGGLSVAKVVLLDKTLNKVAAMEGEQATNYARLQFVLRYLLTIVVLVGVVLLKGAVGLFGTILGILSLQLGAYLTHLVERRREKKNPPAEKPVYNVIEDDPEDEQDQTIWQELGLK